MAPQTPEVKIVERHSQEVHEEWIRADEHSPPKAIPWIILEKDQRMSLAYLLMQETFWEVEEPSKTETAGTLPHIHVRTFCHNLPCVMARKEDIEAEEEREQREREEEPEGASSPENRSAWLEHQLALGDVSSRTRHLATPSHRESESGGM